MNDPKRTLNENLTMTHGLNLKGFRLIKQDLINRNFWEVMIVEILGKRINMSLDQQLLLI